ncbi:MAG: hypothetical protein ACE148_17845 [Vicinamibacterales bacterium]
MKILVIGLSAVLVFGCVSAVAQDAAAQGATDDARYVLLQRQLAVEIEGKGGTTASIETHPHLLKFDTATGRVWRFEQRDWGTPKATVWFVPIPLEGVPEDVVAGGTAHGPFQLHARSGDAAPLYLPDVCILDPATGRTWVYRGIRQTRNGVTVMKETFALVKDTGPQ